MKLNTTMSFLVKLFKQKGLLLAALVCLLSGGNAIAQGQTVTGQVLDLSGNPFPAVNVIVKGTTPPIGVVTDSEGRYTITVPSAQSELQFSFIGYLTEEVLVADQRVINVTLIESIEALGEIVVIGYGTMQRANVTGAISSVSAEELAKAPIPNMVEAMRGLVPGLRMSRTSGMPGSGVEFLIRGKNSLTSSNEPLIVVDGVPFTGGNLAEINPADIESINILKDASAASIYGARGANGVILITTKRGVYGPAQVHVNVSRGITDLVQKPTLFNAEEYVQLKREVARTMGMPYGIEDVLGDVVERENYLNNRTIDWHDVLLRQGQVTNAMVSVTGGTEKMTYYMSGDVFLEEGIVHHTDFNRYSFRLNTDYRPNRFMKIGARLQVSASTSDETGQGAVLFNNRPDFTDFIGNSPLGRLYDENNELVPTVKGDQFQFNPLYKYAHSSSDRRSTRAIVSPFLEIQLIEGLTYTLNASADRRFERFGRFESSRYNFSTLLDEPANNRLRVSSDERASYLLDNILSYSRSFDVHNINATLVYGFNIASEDFLEVSGEGSPTDNLSYHSLGAANSDFYRANLTTDDTRNLYYVGRLGYSFDRRYNATVTVRRDLSSVFGPDNRVGIFPSAAFAWNICQERFMQNQALINSLKYRISWGRMGNDRIGTFRFIELTQSVSYPFDGADNTGYTAGNLPNRALRWETSQQFNTGIDFSMIGNRLFGTVDFYRTNTIDLLLDQEISAVTGHTTILSNIGETQNQGLEISLNYRILDGQFKWLASANWARDRSKIIRLNEFGPDGEPLDNEANGWFIGQDIDVVYAYKFDGIYQLTDVNVPQHPIANHGPGHPKMVDRDGDGRITFENDRFFLGSLTPDWYGGIRNTFSYRGFELTVLLETVQGVTRRNYFYGDGLTGRDNQVKVNYWTPENPSNEFPRPRQGNAYGNSDMRTATQIRDASFIALRNVSLSYTLPRAISMRARLESVQLYIRGNNLRYFTDYKDAYSPETEFGAFPITKNWTFGTNLTF